MTDFTKRIFQGSIIVSCLAFFCGCTCCKPQSMTQDSGRYQMAVVQRSDERDYIVLKCDTSTGDIYVIGCNGVDTQTKWKEIQ
jgi:hypothetical protein